MQHSAPAPEGELALGSLLAGKYHVEARLGRGGMGEVYRVLDERTGQQVALKRRLRSAESDDAARALQFEREYHTLCELAHPSIIEVYDYGVSEAGAYYTMELLDGRDLREVGQLPWRQACALLVDVASSLAIVHSRGFLHRDVSPRNVRCTADGRAKLIDFGAMTPFGPARNLVGTPPFIPPEALQAQALDARADLFALGAMAYSMLTGRHAYAARSLDELRAVWTAPVAPIAHLQRDVPEALDRLVLGLLHLNRGARPATAAEVMERLAGIAGLAQRERVEVTRAYLVAPPLIGRKAQLDRVRAQLVAAQRELGLCALVEGAPGTGRSRFLDACVLEAKLLGASVLRADASDGADGEYGAVRALCTQLLQDLPQLAQRSAAQRRNLLACIVKELDFGARVATPDPVQLQAALSDWFLTVARSTQLVIAIDDADAIDAPSAAWLATLALRPERRGLSLLFTRNRSLELSAALALVHSVAQVVELAPFGAVQTEAFIRGVFGVDEVGAVAERIHRLAEGNPRETMALLEWLVERGTAHYEAGSWTLPVELKAAELPVSLTAAWTSRIEALSPDARELGEVLSLTDPTLLAVADYPKLTAAGQLGRTHRAIDTLIGAGILVAAGPHYRFRQAEIPELLSRSLAPEQRRELHGRLAAVLVSYGDELRLSHHLLSAGREPEALERLLPLYADPRVEISSWSLSVVQQALEASKRVKLSPSAELKLHLWFMSFAAVLGDYTLFVRHAIPVLQQFERDSGLADYLELDPALPAQERLVQSLTRAQQRYDQTPEAERRFSPIDSVRWLALACSGCVNMASIAQSLELVESLPSLQPLAVLSPALSVSQLLVDCMRAFQAGRYDEARGFSLRVLERVQQPDLAGLEPVIHEQVRLGMMYFQAVISTIRGNPKAAEWLPELEQAPGHRVNAWRVHMASELMQGNYQAAATCQRRSELAQVQDVQQTRYRGTTVRLELLAHARANDLLGVKRVMERIEPVARSHPRWEVDLCLARYHYKRLQDDAAGALDALLPALQLVAPGRHINWTITVATHVRALCEVGREAEAAELGFEYLASHEREGLSGMTCELTQSLAEALVKLGRFEEAVGYADRCIREAEAMGSRGVFLGVRYETRARVALAMGDREMFKAMADCCAREYKPGSSSALTVLYERLMRDADQPVPPVSHGDAASALQHAGNPRSRTIIAGLSACTDATERAEQALQLLAELSGASAGYLFGVQQGVLTLRANLACPGELPALLVEALDVYFAQHVAADLEPDAVPTATRQNLQAFRDSEGRPVSPMLLIGGSAGARELAGLAVLHFGAAARRAIDPELLDAIATALLGDSDMDVLTVLS